jgi:hypothetical protein
LILNQSSLPFPLESLQIGDDRLAIQGGAWKLSSLKPGECVIATKDKGKPKLPNLKCQQAARLEVTSFWKEPFNIYYNEKKLLTCQNGTGEDGDKICILVVSQ